MIKGIIVLIDMAIGIPRKARPRGDLSRIGINNYRELCELLVLRTKEAIMRCHAKANVDRRAPLIDIITSKTSCMIETAIAGAKKEILLAMQEFSDEVSSIFSKGNRKVKPGLLDGFREKLQVIFHNVNIEIIDPRIMIAKLVAVIIESEGSPKSTFRPRRGHLGS
jgi:hypothetical protein